MDKHSEKTVLIEENKEQLKVQPIEKIDNSKPIEKSKNIDTE